MKWRPYPGYKPSGVEWLGEIPEHWDVLRLKNIAGFGYGDSLPAEVRIPGHYDVYGSNGIVGQHELPNTQPPCLIIGRKGSFGKVAYSEKPCFAIDTTYFIDCTLTRNDLRWLYYCLQWLNLDSFSKDSAVPGLSREDAYENLVPYCPIDNQRAIAAFLDGETARIDALMEKKQRQIELLQEKRSALISHAVTKGLDSTVPLKDSGAEWLGKIPAHWSKAPVYARYHVQLGKMLDSKRITGDSLAPYVRNVDVQWDRISVIDLNEMDFSDDDKKRYRLEYGDLLVCEGGEIGRTAIWRGELKECYYQKAIHRLRPKNNSDSSRYFYYIMFAAAKSGLFIATGNPNTIDHLTAEKLRTHRFPFPPRDEQDDIVTFLEKATAHTDALIARIQESIDRLKEYRTALISSAVTGQIDVREEAA